MENRVEDRKGLEVQLTLLEAERDEAKDQGASAIEIARRDLVIAKIREKLAKGDFRVRVAS